MEFTRKVSIALPAFKATFLAQAIDSILNQTFTDFELIIVNDASPEDIDSIVNSYSDNRISYHKNAVNIGSISLVRQWNYCLELTKGEYFVLASDDDIYHPRFLEALLDLSIKYSKVDVFHSRVATIDENGKPLDYTSCCGEWESPLTFVWHKICKFRDQYMPEFMFRRDTLVKNGGFVDLPSAWGTDHATTFLVSKENGVACHNESLFMWRYSGLNISGSGNFSINKLKALISYIQWLDNFLTENLFTENLELKPLIAVGIRKYFTKRAPMLLKEHKYIALFKLLIVGQVINNKVDRAVTAKAIAKKMLTN